MALHRLSHHRDRLVAYLVAAAARSRVDEERDAAELETEACGRFRQVDLLDDLDLQEVISRAQRTELRCASLHCGLAHGVRLRTAEATAFLRVVEIGGVAVP